MLAPAAIEAVKNSGAISRIYSRRAGGSGPQVVVNFTLSGG